MYFNPLKIFLPISATLLAAAIGKYLIYDIALRQGFPLAYVPALAGSTLALFMTGLQVGVIGLLADLIVRRTRL
jgi:hypothetical protein